MVIQRVQTLYLLLALVCSVVFIFIPFAYGSDFSVVAADVVSMLVMMVVASTVSLVDIFLYKKPGLQKGLIIVDALLLIATAAVMFVEISRQELSLGASGLLLVASLIGLIAAYRGISSDQKLLRSLDRIR